MHAGGREADQYISVTEIRSGDHILLIHYTYGKSRKIIFVCGIKARHLSGLAADQRCLGLQTAVRDSLDDLRDLFRIVLSARNIIQEKQRLAARTGDIVHAHGNTVDSDGIMLVHQKCDFQLCPYAVSSGNQCGMLHVLERIR